MSLWDEEVVLKTGLHPRGSITRMGGIRITEGQFSSGGRKKAGRNMDFRQKRSFLESVSVITTELE